MPSKTCLRCSHRWFPRTRKPKQCPSCHSSGWERKPLATWSRRPKVGDIGTVADPGKELAVGGSSEVSRVIGAFRAINPAASFSDPRNREAAGALIDAYGLERVLSAIAAAGKANGQEYAPVISSLGDLLEKWPKLEAFYRRKSKPTHVKIS